MIDVKTALIISEYYPAVLPTGEMAGAPVTRLTPHFHDILVENVTATATKSAGAIAGLPEAPIKGVTLRNVSIQAPQGLTIGNAEVTTEHLEIQPAFGPAITKLPGTFLVLR
jgi:hypothetical protein